MEVIIKDKEGKITTMQLSPKVFKSGKVGYWEQMKMTTTDGKRYQVQVQAVEIQ